MSSLRLRFATWLANTIAGTDITQLAVSVRIDDSPGWSSLARYPHDRTLPEIQQLYEDSLKAWRKNPLAWNTVRITTDYVVGDGITISSSIPHLQEFIDAFWSHPENHIDNRLETMVEELTRSGDLFPVLFRNHQDGMSYLRFLTKDQIQDVEHKKSDWETEMVIVQKATGPGERPRNWYTPKNGRSHRSHAIILHHSINRPMGAVFGEGDLVSVLPWLLKYSRMVEERTRLHWAVRAFLWFVKVPSSKVKAKREQYKAPPEPGSIVVHDEAEEWEVKTPNLRGADASHDMKAVRNMIDAGTGYPPHWRGESADVNLATAQAMQEPVERHLKRRQQYFSFVLMDIIYHAYQRASQHSPDRYPALTETSYKTLFSATTTDISSTDNVKLAQATKELMAGLKELSAEFPNAKPLKRLMLKLALKFAGEPQDDAFFDHVLSEAQEIVSQNSATGSQRAATYANNGRFSSNGHKETVS